MAKKNNPSSKKADESSPVTQERSVEEALAESTAGEAIASLEKNKTWILLVAVLVTVGFCGFLVAKQLKEAKNSEAAQAFSSAMGAKDTDALDRVVADFPGTAAAGNSLLTKADILLNRGKPEDAKKVLETFVGDFDSHPRVAQGVFAIANIAHKAGDLEGAKTNYEKALALQPDGDLSPLIRIRLGDLVLEGGDAEQAELLYLESISKHPGNPFVGKAEQKIALAKIGDPPLVDRPEPEPEPVPEPEKEKPAIEAPVIQDGGKPANPSPESQDKPAVAPEAPADSGKGDKPAKAKAKGKGKGAVDKPAVEAPPAAPVEKPAAPAPAPVETSVPEAPKPE